MKTLIRRIKIYFSIRKANKELDDAIVQADKMFQTYNKRYYVLPDYNHRLRVLSWSQIKQMRKQGVFSSSVNEADFISESFYYTPSRIEKTYLKPETKEKKRKSWIAYYKAYRIG